MQPEASRATPPFWPTTRRIASKELSLFFSSPIGYLFLLAYLGATLFAFFWGETFFARNISDVRPMFEWLPVLLIFLASALTMRMWSEERRSGTLEFVVTMPASVLQFVVGKFLACLTLLAIALGLTLPLPITVSVLGDLDWGPVLCGYAAAAFLGATYLAIGQFQSARSDNQIVALILSVLLCGAFYMLGHPLVTDLFGSGVTDVLRRIGAGSRFESITRGVLDFRDLWFYASLVGLVLAGNVIVIERQGWAQAQDGASDEARARHRRRRRVVALIVVNLLLSNVWVNQIAWLRWDVTEGNQYSISEATRNYLRQLREPLLIRGYFSEKTHPLLAPLAPQLKDLLTEYEVAGDGQVRLELVDPADDPEIEDEANTKYGIRPVPFQVADRYQASLVNSYFDVLIGYGDEYEVLGFRELIDVKVRGESDLDVQLRSPEYDITRSIKKVLFGFQGGGSVFDSITDNVTFVGYLSPPEQLPEALADLRVDLDAVLAELEAESDGKLAVQTLDPDAGDGSVALQIAEDYGFRPMAASLFDANTFYFYLTLTDGETVVQMPIPESFDADGLKRGIEEGLKRFAAGLLKTVALSAPEAPPPYMAQQMPQPPGNEYASLRDVLGADFDLESASLSGGEPPATAEVLFVVDPKSLDEQSVFAIDQFLMQGGTVVLAASSFNSTYAQDSLYATPNDTGLDDWLAHHGLSLDKSFVMDPQNAAFPLPVIREVGGFRFQDVQMQDYPYFVDVRGDGLNADNAITSGVPQLTMTWASPVEVDEEANSGRTVTTLVQSSPASWRSTDTDIMPKLDVAGEVTYTPVGEAGSNTLAVLVEGRFDSFFDESPVFEQARDAAGEDAEADVSEPVSDIEAIDELADLDLDHDPEHDHEAEQGEEGEAASTEGIGEIGTVIERSPESARLVLIGSSTFVSDQNIRLIGSADGTIYANSIQMLANVADWAVEEQSLLSIRSRGHFNRTLPPMSEDDQRTWESVNYLLALVGVGVVFLIARQRRQAMRRRFAGWLDDASANAAEEAA